MVERIDRIVDGNLENWIEKRKKDGKYICYPPGQTLGQFAITFDNLDDVAEYLLDNLQSSVRMNPNWDRVVDDIYIDGIALTELRQRRRT